MSNTDNLISWKPGQSGNPNGRPQEASTLVKQFTKAALQNEFVALMESTVEELERMRENKQTTPIAAACASYLLRCRAKGEFPEAILERVLGKVPQKNELTGADGEPLTPAVVQFAPYAGPDPHAKPTQNTPQTPPVLPAVEQIPAQPTSGQPPAF